MDMQLTGVAPWYGSRKLKVYLRFVKSVQLYLCRVNYFYKVTVSFVKTM